MASGKRNRKIILAAVALLLVVLSVLYLIFAESIADFFEKFDPRLAYSDMVGVYTDPPGNGTVEIHVIDVGQADSILIRSSQGNVLIDAGTTSSEADLKAHLNACGIELIDCFVCTHPHDDHIGGADMILDSFKVGKVIMADIVSGSFAFEKMLNKIAEHSVDAVTGTAGHEFAVGDMNFKIMAPLSDTDDTNDSSLIVKMEFGDTSFLFMGDAGFDVESDLLASNTNGELDCDFIKIGHHGANTSTGTDFLNAVTPTVAAISCGKDNEYGHPRGETLARIADSGCDTVLRTDRLGTIVVSSDGKKLTAITDSEIK